MEQTTGSMKWESRYSNMSKNEFKTLILMNKEKSRYDYVYFILNTLLQIFYDYSYCYCHDFNYDDFKNGFKCKICTISSKFPDFENDIEKNTFIVDYLIKYYERLCDKLLKLFDEKEAIK